MRFEPVVALGKDAFGAESLERPALVHTPEGRWRLYVSCATPGTKHWRVDLLEADTVEGLATRRPGTVLPGSDTAAVKDPVLRHDGQQWHLWASVHPLRRPGRDRPDDHRARHQPRRRQLDLAGHRAGRHRRAAGTPAASGSPPSCWTATAPGRCTTAGPRRRRTGRSGPAWPCSDGDGGFTAAADGPLLQSPHPPAGLRYADVVAVPGGGARWFYEATRADGAHELRTVLLPG